MKKDKGFNLNTLFSIAKKINDDDAIQKDGLLITYYLDSKVHKLINEELHYRLKNSKDELEYGDIIEVKISNIDFILKIKEDE